MRTINKITYNINHCGIDIKLVHKPEYLSHTDHVEWWSEPCSYTETGFKSHWFPVHTTKEDIIKQILEEVGERLTVFIKPLEQQSLF
jgi:hypothetical protein